MISNVSPTAEPDPASLIEAYFERGWTDGLPVVPPTEKSVAEMLAGGALRGDEQRGLDALAQFTHAVLLVLILIS